ncbi:GlxA family transcriptional regulator [Halomonas salipaludis]|uniref:AraC family transcriptional regulator n=1 Tax=Halomonas salipaludis TaxID=2032625 RepID=A0A2A2EQR5_9GAMM|nr:helix-turn-helix domain-containing protein [Halomonas salipaludis]PAU74725.1 AraC family transcriptional regulator [Halomonas salipaludis]
MRTPGLPDSAPSTPPYRLKLMLMPAFSFAGLGTILDSLFIINWLAQEPRFEWQLLGLEESVMASNGTPLAVEREWPAPHTLDEVWVLASFATKSYRDDTRLAMWLRHCAAAGANLGGIEVGSDMLAAAGVMQGHRVAMHWDNREGFAERYPQLETSSELYCLDRDRLSCAGGTAIVDLMFAWLARHVEPALLEELRNHLLERRQRDGTRQQLAADPLHHAETSAQIRRVLRHMRRHIEAPLSTAELASHAGLSTRQLERRFKHELGVTPMRYYLWLRINRAHRLLQQTDLSVASVASAAGFASLEHFSRSYRRFFGCAPSSDRLQSPEAPVLPLRYLPYRRR